VRIAMIASGDGPNARYRVFGPAEALRARGHTVFASVFAQMRDPNALLGFDVVYGWRMHDEFFTRIAKALAERRIGFVWDNDDNFTATDVVEVDRRGRATRASMLTRRRLVTSMTALMRLADLVTTPSAGLADHFREQVETDVRVIENYVAPARPRPDPARDQLIVGWVANAEHRDDVEQLRLGDTMRRLLDRHPHVHVATIGCGLGLDDERCHHIRDVPFEQLRDYVATFDVGVAPIADSAFNRSRSNVKVKEYAALGIPWLASSIGPYAGLGDGEGGRLVADDRWDEQLDRIVRDSRARRKLAKKGLKWARSQTIEANVGVWEAAFEEAARRARRGV
jgi:glycosyltransferase involved in cell wall biosynthesis